MKRLLFLSAGSSKWGAGHLRRSACLLNVLRDKGVPLSAVAVVPDSVEMRNLHSFVDVYDSCVMSLNDIGPIDVEGIVVDLPVALQMEFLPWLKKQGLSIFAIDWYCNGDGIITEKANLRGGRKALKYAIIREEFQNAYLNHLGQTPSYDIVIVVGSGDIRGHLPKIYKLFSECSYFSDKQIVIILGPIVEDCFANLPVKTAATITILRTPRNIADIMANAKIGITNGGTSLMEFTMLGVPTIIFPQTPEEDNFIKTFLENGCGIYGSLDPKIFNSQVTEMLEDDELRQIRSKKAKRLIDGKGAVRISKLILKAFLDQGRKVENILE